MVDKDSEASMKNRKKLRVKKHRMRRLVTFPRRKFGIFQEKTRQRIKQEANYYAKGGANDSITRTEKLIIKASFIIVPITMLAMLLKWIF